MFPKSTKGLVHFKCPWANRASQSEGNFSSATLASGTEAPPGGGKNPKENNDRGIGQDNKSGNTRRRDKMEATGKEEKQKYSEMGLLKSRQAMKFILVPGFRKSQYVLCSH